MKDGNEIYERWDDIRRATNPDGYDEEAEWLNEHGYASIEEWAADSDYVQDDDDDWFYPADYADPTVAGTQVDIYGCLHGAMEAEALALEAEQRKG